MEETGILAAFKQRLKHIRFSGQDPERQPGVPRDGLGRFEQFRIVFPARPADQADVGVVLQPRGFRLDQVGGGLGPETRQPGESQ